MLRQDDNDSPAVSAVRVRLDLAALGLALVLVLLLPLALAVLVRLAARRALRALLARPVALLAALPLLDLPVAATVTAVT